MHTLANTNVVYRGHFCWCDNTYIHSLEYIAIRVGLGPVKSSRNEDSMAYTCDVSSLCRSQQNTINMSMIL